MDAHSTLVQSIKQTVVTGQYGEVIATLSNGDIVAYRFDLSGVAAPQSADFIIRNTDGEIVVAYTANSGRNTQRPPGFAHVSAVEAAKYYPMKIVVAYLEAVQAYAAEHPAVGWLAERAVKCVAADLKYFKLGVAGKNNVFLLPV